MQLCNYLVAFQAAIANKSANAAVYQKVPFPLPLSSHTHSPFYCACLCVCIQFVSGCIRSPISIHHKMRFMTKTKALSQTQYLCRQVATSTGLPPPSLFLHHSLFPSLCLIDRHAISNDNTHTHTQRERMSLKCFGQIDEFEFEFEFKAFMALITHTPCAPSLFFNQQHIWQISFNYENGCKK